MKKVTQCTYCPCSKSDFENGEWCMLGYNVFISHKNGESFYSSDNCGLESVKYAGGEFIKPEPIEVN